MLAFLQFADAETGDIVVYRDVEQSPMRSETIFVSFWTLHYRLQLAWSLLEDSLVLREWYYYLRHSKTYCTFAPTYDKPMFVC